jgi:MFS superfamily sulfate permease-like transporter
LGLGLLAAVAVGVILTLLLVIVELDHVVLTELQPTVDGDDVEAAGPGTRPEPGLLILRFDGPLYTANIRTANRKVIAAVDAAKPQVLVIDATAVAMLSVTVIDEFAQIEQALRDRGADLWIAALPPRALATVRLLPRWADLEVDGRLHPTALAAMRRYRDS